MGARHEIELSIAVSPFGADSRLEHALSYFENERNFRRLKQAAPQIWAHQSMPMSSSGRALDRSQPGCSHAACSHCEELFNAQRQSRRRCPLLDLGEPCSQFMRCLLREASGISRICRHTLAIAESWHLAPGIGDAPAKSIWTLPYPLVKGRTASKFEPGPAFASKLDLRQRPSDLLVLRSLTKQPGYSRRCGGLYMR